MASPVTVTRRGPGLAELQRSLKRLKDSDVLIGIPAAASSRRGQPVNNAELLFIHSKGSALRNIPARPVLEPAIEANRETIAPQLGNAARNVLQQKPELADQDLKRAGMIASNAAKRWFTDARNGWAPNSPATVKRKGSDQPLVDTGSMRRAITFVVRVNP